ncbi:serine/threonine-protein kinase TBK1-like isoform X2 [Amphiura filiformis]
MFNPNIPLGSDYSPGQLRSTPSYIFKTADVLGEGATSKVFLGRNKKSGEKVAVKVFNNESFQRPDAVQEREFNVLLKINHKNIVKLLAIENDQISKHRIIILELCGCSVLNMLDEPKYIYGFPDQEFLQVLGDTTSGMKYLQEQGIVHRDIKPGNVMKRLGPGRCPIYKLADFGAARQLQAEENFTSLYGTEEYLHPHMFERALLKKPLVKPFNAKVDLWSFGVTVYHIATGLLPFRPYGGRKNRSTMHKLTTQKATGVISAVQRESEDGPIEYGTELPKNTRMTFGLKFQITDMLAGLLESNTDKMWSFETLFQMVQSILNMRVLDILCVSSAQLVRIYIDPTASYAEFQEHVAVQTSIPSDMQIHIYDNEFFHPEASVTCASYPVTSEEDPIYLIPHGFKGSATPVSPNAPSMPEVKSNYSLDGDYPLARLCAGVLHFMQWKQSTLLTTMKTFTPVVKAIRRITRNEVMELRVHLVTIDVKQQSVENSLQCVSEKTTFILELVDSYLLQANGSIDEGNSVQQTLIGIQNEIDDTKQSLQAITAKQLLAKKTLATCEDTMSWENIHECRADDRCFEKLDVFREGVEEIMTQYRRDRRSKHLGYNEVQIHKMEKLKLRELTTEAVSLLRNHCENNWRECHLQLMEWFQQISPIQENIRTVDSLLTNLINEEYPRIVAVVNAKCAIWESRLLSTRENLAGVFKMSGKTQLRSRGLSMTPRHGKASSSIGKLTSAYMNGNEQPTIYHPPDSPESLSLQMSSAGASNVTMISVPRSLKQELQSYESTADRTKETIELSKQLMKEIKDASLDSSRFMEELQDFSLGISDQPDVNLVNHLED